MINFPYSFAAMTAITTTMLDANFSAINSAANVANGPVFLDAGSRLPAVDGSLLTNVVTNPFLAACNFTVPGGALNGQSNVASVTHTSTGRFDIAFTAPLAVTPTVIIASGGLLTTGNFLLQPDFVTASGFRLYCYNGAVLVDPTGGNISVAVLM